jgi:hypothetical protein
VQACLTALLNNDEDMVDLLITERQLRAGAGVPLHLHTQVRAEIDPKKRQTRRIDKARPSTEWTRRGPTSPTVGPLAESR